MEIAGRDRRRAQEFELALWNAMFVVIDCVPLKTLPEAEEMFAGFEPLAE